MKKQPTKPASTTSQPGMSITGCYFQGGVNSETASALLELAKAAHETARATAAVAEAFTRVGSLTTGLNVNFNGK